MKPLKRKRKVKASNSTNRTIRKIVRFSSKELALVEDKMNETGILNFSQYVRSISIQGKIVVTDLSAIKQLTTEINRIGVNINQLSRVANSTHSLTPEEFNKLKKDVQQLTYLVANQLENGLVKLS